MYLLPKEQSFSDTFEIHQDIQKIHDILRDTRTIQQDTTGYVSDRKPPQTGRVTGRARARGVGSLPPRSKPQCHTALLYTS